MQASTKKAAGVARNGATREAGWAYTRDVLEHNYELGEQVLWCLRGDWARMRPRFDGFSLPDRLFQEALTWEWWAVVQYRFSYWAHHRSLAYPISPSLIARFYRLQQNTLLRVCYLTGKLIEALAGTRLNPLAEIGPGFLLVHTGSCGIGAGTCIGCNFTMYQDANIVAGRDNGCASLGDNVTLYSGARVIGAVTIGDGASVGANAVVTRDLPAGCLAVGAPAKPLFQGDRSPDYPVSAALRDLVTTLEADGKLEALGNGRYRDRETGEVVTVVFTDVEDGSEGVS